MNLTEQIVQSFDAQQIEQMACENNIKGTQLESVLSLLTSGFLSALKAKLVVGLHTGSIQELTDVFTQSNADLTLEKLFGENQSVLNLLTQRASEMTGVSQETINQMIPALFPTIATAIVGTIQSTGLSAISKQASQEIAQFLQTGSAGSVYETAIAAANKFIGSVFGGSVAEKLDEQTNQMLAASSFSANDFVYNLLEMLDSDKDGQVMDDIYNSLVK